MSLLTGRRIHNGSRTAVVEGHIPSTRERFRGRRRRGSNDFGASDDERSGDLVDQRPWSGTVEVHARSQ
jgi:hypothetical protein